MPVRLSSHKNDASATVTKIGVAPEDRVENLSKITPPTLWRVHPNLRLFGRLDASSDRPIVWIHGPPGAGKTTLVASYLNQRRVDPLWYKLDEGDADPASVFFYLGAAWTGRKVGKRLPLLTAELRMALPLFTRRFFRALFTCSKTTTLVFDDYHEVPAAALLHECLANGLAEIPKGCRVFVISRTPPPGELARLRLNGLVDVIEPDALRVTLGEAEGLARERGASVAKIGAIIEHTQGWTAGLILMLEAGAEAVRPPADGAPIPEVLFDYFAGEILQRMDAGAQRHLCMLSLMPTMNAAMAQNLTGSAEAGALLEDLRKRNYFTTRNVAVEPRYRFHPMFRDFLCEGLRSRLSHDERHDVYIQAAEILESDRQPDAAVGLLAAVQAHHLLADLLRRQAESLLEEGRYDTFNAWLAHLPPPLVEADPLLSYWIGEATVHFDPKVALQSFQRAFTLFKDADDVSGQFLAWAGQADAVRLDAFGDQARADPLIESLRDLLARHPDLPPGIVTLRVATGMAIGLIRRGNNRDEIQAWQNRATVAASDTSFAGRRELVGFIFALHGMHDAQFASVRDALDTLPDPLKLDRHPVSQINGLFTQAMMLLYRQKAGDCGGLIEEALQRVETAGYLLWMPMFASMAARDAGFSGRAEECGAWVRRTGALSDRVSPNRGYSYHVAAVQFHLMIGDLAAAKIQADAAVNSALKGGWLFFESTARLARAEVFADANDLDEAEAEMLRLEGVFARCATHLALFGAMLLKADLRRSCGDETAATALLADAIAFGRDRGDRCTYLTARRTGRLCAYALKSGIEPDYVRTLIRASGLAAPDPDEAAWPWPLKISTLGGLEVTIDGAPLTFSRKTPKRLITLLKAIVTYGGRNVPEEKLIDAIWPDEDGDAGKSALKVAIHRLRQLLGDPGALIVKEGQVGLDPSRCWLDLWSFERLLSARTAQETEVAFQDRVKRGLTLYGGDFLAADDELWWTARRRERMRERCRQTGGAAPP